MAALGVVGEGLVELGLEPPPDPAVALGFGGDVANAAVMASRLGAAARIGGRVGDDALGRRLLTFWAGQGVDVRHVVVDAGGPTGIYVNERGAEGPHRFDYHRAASAGSRLAVGDLGDGFFAGLGVLHVSGITLAVSESAAAAALDAVERARATGALISVAVNHRPALGGEPGALVRLAETADVVFASDEEAAGVFGAATPAELATSLGGVAEVVVTRGAEGAVLHHGGDGTVQRALPVEVVDPAGAGDALAGAYLASRLGGAEPVRALRVGVAAACLSCRSRGCALSYPARAEVERAAGPA
ncbi:MAG: sugar kinase [Thermoleophilia bacterium]|nr:sugar kinase [Thermoleophilia bacterium]